MTRFTFILLALISTASAQPVATVDPAPTTRPIAAASVQFSPVIQPSAPQVIIAPDPVRTVDLPLWAGYHYPCTVRVNVKMISAVVPHVATAGGVQTTGSAVYCWPADIWYTTVDVTTLTTQLAAAGWGQGAPLASPAGIQQPLPSKGIAR